MISQVINITLLPDVAGQVNALLQQNIATLNKGPTQLMLLENRNRRTVTVVATFEDKAALDDYFSRPSTNSIMLSMFQLSAGHVDFYETLTEVVDAGQ